MAEFNTIGFIGLGVMGEPMCRNLASKLSARVIAFDLKPDPLERLAEVGVEAAATVEDVVKAADLVLLSLPGSAEVERICIGEGGIAGHGRAGLVVADLSTCSVETARNVGEGLEEKGIAFADTPVTRTAKAAVEGTLSIMAGCDAALYARLEPVLATMGTDINHAGPVGSGQVLKILNNMVCFETVVAIAEAMTMAKRAGVDPQVLYDVLSKGSADSFALRNHGMKSMLPGVFATRTYSTRYALKDVGYALELAQQTGVNARGAELARTIMREAEDLGFGDNYYPVLVKAVDGTLRDE